MKWTIGLVGAVLAATSLSLAGPALAAPAPSAGTVQAAADAAAPPGQLGSGNPSTVLTEQDNGDMLEGVRVIANGTQGTFKTAAVDGALNPNATQGTFKKTAVDGTETYSEVVTPQKQ